MSRQIDKQQIIAGLMSANSELERALKLGAPPARYDPEVIPQAMRNELSVIVDDIDRMLRLLATTQRMASIYSTQKGVSFSLNFRPA